VSRWIYDFEEAKFFSAKELEKIDPQKLIIQGNEKITIVAVNITDTSKD
jgi:hypothetical protein